MLQLAYWDMRGYCEPARLLLKYFGAEFEDIRYSSANDFKEWYDVKFKLGLDFPNLPYLIDGDLKLTQSQAIVKYIANKFGMVKRDIRQKAVEEMLENEIVDLRARLVRIAYGMNFNNEAELRAEMTILAKQHRESIKPMEKFIGANKFLTGNELSYVDFIAYEYLGWFRELIEKDIYSDCPNLLRFFNNFEELPTLKEYVSSEKYRRGPIMSSRANFGFHRD